MLLNDWRRWLNRLTRSGQGAVRRRRQGRPRLERLEDRLAPAVHDLTTGNTFTTIQAAVNGANPGDTLLADPGAYAESVTVNKSLTIQGNQHGVDAQNGRPGAQESVLDASTNNGRTLFYVTASNVTIDGFVVQNETSANQFGFGVLLGAGTSGSHVLNNIIQSNVVGVGLANNSTASQTVISGNLIQNNNQPGPASGAGIYSDPFVAGASGSGTLTNVLIDNNTFAGNTGDAGIDFSFTPPGTASNVTVSNNAFTGNARALFLLGVTNSSVTQNTITGSTTAGTGDIRLFGGDSGLSITNNLLQNGAGDAIKIDDGLGSNNNPNSNISINHNSISGYGQNGLDILGGYTGTLGATNNYWGSPSGPSTPNNPGGTGQTIIDPNNQVTFSPYFTSGTNNATGRGFTPPANAPTGITVVGTAGDDRLVVNATGPDSGTYQLTTNGVSGPVIPFSNVTRFAFAGLGGNDTFTLNNPAGGLFAPSGGIFYNGGGSGSLQILGGTETTATYTFTPNTAAGHNGTVDLVNGATTAHYVYAGLSPLTNTGTAADVIFNLPNDGTDHKSILEAAAAGMDDLRSQNGTFETTTFANPSSSLTVNVGNTTAVGESLTLAPLDPGFTAPITLNGGTGDDTFNVKPNTNSTAATITAHGHAPATPPGDVLNVDVTGTTNPALHITGNNGGSLSGNYTFGNAGTVFFTGIETLSPTTADLAITKAAPSSVVAGQNITYTLSVTNNGPLSSLDVSLTDATPTNTTFVSFSVPAGWTAGATNPPVGGTGQVTATDPNVAPGTYVFTLVVRVNSSTPSGAAIANTAFVNSATTEDPTSTDNQSSTTTSVSTSADVAITKTGPTGPVLAGSNVTYTLSVTNAGPSDAQAVMTTDMVPANSTLVSFVQNSGPANGSTLPAGGSETFTVVIHVNSNAANGSSITNTAHVSSTTPDPTTADNTSSVTNTVLTQADVAVIKTGPATAVAGQNITYTVTFTNNGPSDAPNAVLNDSVPSGTTFVSFTAPAGWTTTNQPPPGGTGLVQATDPDVVAGAGPQVFTLVVAVPEATTANNTIISNTATGQSGASDPTTADNTSTVMTTVTNQADLAVTKAGPASATPGTNVTYTITLSNAGPNTARNVTLTDATPANTTFVSFNAPAGWSSSTPAVGGTGTVTSSIATEASGAAPVFTLVLRVNPGTPGGTAITNSATASMSSTVVVDPNAGNNTGTATTTTSTPLADVAVTKTGPVTVTAGTPATYTLSLTNSGPSDAQNVVLSDTTPTNTTFSSLTQTSGPAATPGFGNNTATETIPTLAAGASAVFQYVVTVSASAPNASTIQNTATASASTADPNTANNSSTFMSTVTTSADLALTKAGPATAVAGTQVTYTLSVSNAGPSDAQGVRVTDTLPAGETFVSASTGSGSGTSFSAMLGTLAAGASTTVTLVAKISPSAPAGTLTDSASVTATTADPTSADNTSMFSTTVTTSADLALTKTGPASAVAGTRVTYTLSLTNTGPSDAQGVNLSDTLPAGETFVSASEGSGAGTSFTDPVGTLAAGASRTVTVVAMISPSAPAGTLTDSASVTATTADPTSADNTATFNTTVTTSADLALTKTGPATAVAGTQVTYTLSLTNAGPSDAQGVAVTDTLPAGETFVSASEGSGSGTSFTDTVGTFAAGASRIVTVVAKVSPSAPAGTLTDSATVTATTADPTTADNTATFTTTVSTSADVAVTKTGPANVTAGTNATYTISVTNSGPSDAQAVQLTDTLSGGLSFVSASQGTGAGASFSATLGTLAAGASTTITLVARVSPSVGAGAGVADTAVVSSTTADPNSVNNTAVAASAVQAQADLALTMTAPATANQGGPITYTITLTNNGPSDAQAVQVTDSLPANTSFVSASFSQGTSALSGSTVVSALGTVAAGASVTGTVVLQAGLSGAVTNTATVSSTTPDPNPANNSASATVNVAAVAAVGGAAAPLSGFENAPLTNVTVATFTQAGTQPASAFGATIDWGDGSSSSGAITGGNGSYAVVGSHTYTDEHVFTVTVTVTGPGTSVVLSNTANILQQLLPDGTRGTPEQRFIAEAVGDLLGSPVTPAALSSLTPLFTQGELQGVQAILSNPQLAAIAQALLGLPGGTQAVQNLVLSFGEMAVVQALQATPFYHGIPNPGATPLDQLMADYGHTLDRPLDPLGAAVFLPQLQSAGNDAVLVAILSAGPQEYFNKTRA